MKSAVTRRAFLAASFLGAWAAHAGQSGSANAITVAVASNFKDVHESLARRFCDGGQTAIATVSGSTGKLYAQIRNGAPFDVFLSADRKHATLLEDEGLAVKGSRFTYAEGRLALYSANLTIGADWEQILKGGAIKKLAIANPDVAPYGTAAIEVLKKTGLDRAYENKLVKGENISQAFQFVESGGAEAGFVALAQVMSKPSNAYAIVPQDLYTPIYQDAVLLERGKNNGLATMYLAYLASDHAKQTVREAGYALPLSTANEKGQAQ